MSKIAEVKLSSCKLEVADFRENYDRGIAELWLRSNISLKSCGIAIAEVFPSSCGIGIADSKKSCACRPLLIPHATNVNLIAECGESSMKTPLPLPPPKKPKMERKLIIMER